MKISDIYMRNKAILFLLIFTSAISSCNLFITNGNLGASEDIEDSKKREVFVCEYKTAQNPYKINDTLSIVVKSAWLEHQWRYKGLFSQNAEIEKDGYQLIVITSEGSLKGYGKNWLIGISGDRSFRYASYDALITDFKAFPKGNIIEWKVQDGAQLSGSIPKNVIGAFVLKKMP
jgi:hypothetical protein